MSFSRRTLLTGVFATGALSTLPVLTAHAQSLDVRKFIFVVLRGALDGLATLIPDDPEIEALRGTILPARTERLNLGNGFRLHPALASLHSLYKSGDVGFVHAAATRFRGRSHFDGQDALEVLASTSENTGWLNRAVGKLGADASGLAIGYALPLAFMGPAQIANWAPPVYADASASLMGRLKDLYMTDPLFSKAMMDSESLNASKDMMNTRTNARKFDKLTKALGGFMAASNGPNIGMISMGGWDTHSNQSGRLSRLLAEFDRGIAALKSELEASWDKTCIVVCSEFGRTARENGTNGTDHGTGGLVMLLGGAVKGGTIHGDWPGLSEGALFENRDLYPANAIEAVFGGVLRDHLGLSSRDISQAILPGTTALMNGLIV